LQYDKTTITMTGLIITASNKADLKLFSDLARRIGITAKPMSDEDILDYGLLKAMEEGRKTKFVSRERVMKKLTKDED
jgi:hypothetical protein